MLLKLSLPINLVGNYIQEWSRKAEKVEIADRKVYNGTCLTTEDHGCVSRRVLIDISKLKIKIPIIRIITCRYRF